MARMRVVLDDVRCKDTEDVTGADEFYLVGSVSDGANTVGVLTKPISINDDQTKRFGKGGGTVFDLDIPEDRVLKVALVAYDEDAGKDWDKYDTYVGLITTAVSKSLQLIPNPYTVGAGILLPYIVGAVGIIMTLDKDDKLGKHTADFPVYQVPTGEHCQIWSFSGGGGWYSSWKYTVRYRVIKG